jgi:hypothetical protein
MSGAADLVELARRVSAVDDLRALLDGRELTPVTPLPISDETGAADPTEPTAAATALVHPQPFDVVGTPKISWLATQLYGHCYVRPVPRSRSTADAAAVHSFRLALSAANTGRGHWEAGWQVGETSAGQAGPVGEPARRSVRRYGVEFATTPARVRPDGPAARATVMVPKERRELHPGYYVALGDAPLPALGTQPLLRVYWNLRAGGAPAWMAAITAELNRAGIPFMAKLRDHPDGHERADSAVLYLPGGDDGLTHDRLAAVHATVREHLLGDVPMFTRTLAAGVSVATDPGTGLSFGQHRCELVARGLRAHRESGRPDLAKERFDCIVRVFREAGIDPNHPHRAAGEAGDIDTLPAFDAQRPRGLLTRIPARTHNPRDDDLLEAASELGDLLCETAYWNDRDGRCAWIGRRFDVTSFAHGHRTPRPLAVSMDAQLYDGHAGIALFLTELSELTGEERQRRTALGALTTAGRQVQARVSGEMDAGFLTGVCGVVWAASRLAALVQDAAEVAHDLDRLMLDTIDPTHSSPNDVVSGKAGAILTLLALEETNDGQVGDPHVALAVELGRALVTSLSSRRMLTGLAHGASGFGAALLRLHARTGLPEFLEVGRAALDWEDGLFDEMDGSWPDLRDLPTGAAGPRGRAAVTWCNGAAGIAIARLAAATDDPGRRALHLARAATAVELTRTALASRVGPEDDISLCHGSAGLAETLLLGSETLGDPGLAAEAREAMAAVMAHGAWLNDVGRDLVRANPSLMLGAAGMGHQLLRLHAPSVVPTVLGGPRTTPL